MSKPETKQKSTRRQFLKATGLAGAVLGGGGLGVFGYAAGKDFASYTGCANLEGAHQIDRTKWELKEHPYKPVGPTDRPDPRVEFIFDRGMYRNTELYAEFCKTHPEAKEADEEMAQFRKRMNKPRQGRNETEEGYAATLKAWEESCHISGEDFDKLMAEDRAFQDEMILSEAWSNAMGAVSPRLSDLVRGGGMRGRMPGQQQPQQQEEEPSWARTSPEKTDAPRRREPLEMKDPKLTSKLIKKMAHEFGSVLVGITKLNPDWVYKYGRRGRGFEPDKVVEVPKHWEYAIVVGTPMSWDPMYANPNFGTSDDAYSKSRIVAYRLTAFIKSLGYWARPHTPGSDYDLMAPPIMVDAGLGEQGRHSIVITPELGCNFRPAIITTDIPMEVDKPIEFGVREFCKTCKICAETCPSGAITLGEETVVRGYKRYQIDYGKCYNFWSCNQGNIGCRLCVSVCPFTRKANWLHTTALKVTAMDKTGTSHKVLTKMQKLLYPPTGKPEDYYMARLGGKNESYREPPWWMKTEDFIKL